MARKKFKEEIELAEEQKAKNIWSNACAYTVLSDFRKRLTEYGFIVGMSEWLKAKEEEIASWDAYDREVYNSGARMMPPDTFWTVETVTKYFDLVKRIKSCVLKTYSKRAKTLCSAEEYNFLMFILPRLDGVDKPSLSKVDLEHCFKLGEKLKEKTSILRD